jgi:hypothetical protein
MPRQRFIQDPKTHKLIPIEEWIENQHEADAPYVMPDIQPYKSMQTGEMITSRSHHKAHLKQHGLVEIGNEVKAAMTQHRPKDDREGRRRAIAEVLNARGY